MPVYNSRRTSCVRSFPLPFVSWCFLKGGHSSLLWCTSFSNCMQCRQSKQIYNLLISIVYMSEIVKELSDGARHLRQSDWRS